MSLKNASSACWSHCTRLRSVRRSQQKLEGLLYQQQNILDNHLNRLMIDHNGQADSITPDEIVGAYEIATIHNGHPSNFLLGWKDYKVGFYGCLTVKN